MNCWFGGIQRYVVWCQQIHFSGEQRDYLIAYQVNELSRTNPCIFYIE